MRAANPTGFTRKMYELCELAPRRVKGYYPHDFRQALERAGDDFAPRAKEFLRSGLQSGLERLTQGGAIDISMEWSIAYDDWPEFDKADRELAHQRLAFVSKFYKLPPPPGLRR
jgi:hypothetical protein